MSFAFDLASHEDVRSHGEAIYATLAAGQMPYDGASAEQAVQPFRSWPDMRAFP
jgi:hypothetical protein